MRVKMVPHLSKMERHESGIKRVCEAYIRYAKDYGIDYVEPDDEQYDILAIHAGMSTVFEVNIPMVSHLHGLYWTADYDAHSWEWAANQKVIASIRHATMVTVPSEWVAESLRRDMHVDPVVIHHGIDWKDWAGDTPNNGYILWNKNRHFDVCDPYAVGELAKRFPNNKFISTFLPPGSPSNVKEIGLVTHEDMKLMILRSAVYMSTTKETFGIGVLEALAAGVPVLGFNWGGNKIMVKHGVNGYLARPNDFADLEEGLNYCLLHNDILGKNARLSAREYTWASAMEKVSNVYREAMMLFHDRRRQPKLDAELYRIDDV